MKNRENQGCSFLHMVKLRSKYLWKYIMNVVGWQPLSGPFDDPTNVNSCTFVIKQNVASKIKWKNVFRNIVRYINWAHFQKSSSSPDLYCKNMKYWRKTASSSTVHYYANDPAGALPNSYSIVWIMVKYNGKHLLWTAQQTLTLKNGKSMQITEDTSL